MRCGRRFFDQFGQQVVDGGLEGPVHAGGDGVIAYTAGAEEAEGVAFADQDGEALVKVAAIGHEVAAETGERGDPAGAQSDEGFFLAISEAGQSHDGVNLRKHLSKLAFGPVVHTVQGVLESLHGRKASGEGVFDALGEGRPRRLEEVEVLGGQALQEGVEDLESKHVLSPFMTRE